MATHDVAAGAAGAERPGSGRAGNAARRLTTEKKQFFKTSEFAAERGDRNADH